MKLNRLLALVSAFGISTAIWGSMDYVHHPETHNPIYVNEGIYDSLKGRMATPPKSGDARQLRDEQELFALQKSRTETDCAKARNEIFVTLQNFFGPPDGPLSAAQVAALNPLFGKVSNDTNYFVQKLKLAYPRPRPFAYLPKLEECVGREVSGAYPSGHAAISEAFALVLSDLYPKKRKAILKRAQEIANHRVLSSMHHRSDVEAGAELGKMVYEELKKSKKFQADFKAARFKVAKG